VTGRGLDQGSTYAPLPEADGGWRFVEVEAPERRRLESALLPERDDDVSGTVVVHRGWIAAERYTGPVLRETRFDIWSCTKSLTALAFALLLDDVRRSGGSFRLDDPAYSWIPEGKPLSDPRKERITVRHLLSMTSAIKGERCGFLGNPTRSGVGLFEFCLGRAPNASGASVAELAGEPGTIWDYSDAGYGHLALIFSAVAGAEIGDYLQARLFTPIGIPAVPWDRCGGGSLIGPYTNPHTGVHMSARDLARVGYLLLRRGSWDNRRVVPEEAIRELTSPSQALEPCYGLGFWLNTNGVRWQGVPEDAFALSGFRCNVCFVIPSLDLVIAHVASGPGRCDKAAIAARVIDAIGGR
jgi:CubicO group peptidase (beta-lactamase class C family)